MPPLVYLVVAFAFVAEAVTGFGGTVITVTLGAQLLPLDQLLPLYVPVNFVLSATLAWQGRRHIQQAFLTRKMLPLVALGMAAGLAIYRVAPPGPLLLLGYGALVATLAALELARGPRSSSGAGQGVGQVLGLLGGGVIHGIYGSGGPLVVWATSQQLAEKSTLRATLAVLWLVLGAVLMVQYVSLGQLTLQTLATSATLLPVLAAGLWLGHKVHDRVQPVLFRKLVYGLLLAGALSLLVRHGIKLVRAA